MMLLKRGARHEDVKTVQRILHLYPDGIFGPLTEEAVREFQKANGLSVDGIVGPLTWTKLNETPAATQNLQKSTRTIKEIIIHCADTPEGKDYTVDDIRKWHLARGFSDIGYHYVIYRDGTVHLGRNINIAGAHCLNHNTISIGICYIGGQSATTGAPKDTRTNAQKATLLKMLGELRILYPNATIHGHKEFANKACPCFEVKQEYKGI